MMGKTRSRTQSKRLKMSIQIAPLFGKIVDSSVWDEPDYVRIIFVTMLAKKDKDHVVRATAYMIGKWARKDESEVLEALKILGSPDRRRKEPQPHEGRRIERVEDGWLILNAEKYDKLMRKENRREYQAEWMRQKRNGYKVGNPNVPLPTQEDEYDPERQAYLRDKSISLRGKGQLPKAEYEELCRLNRMEEAKLPVSAETQKRDQEAKEVFESIQSKDVPY